MDRGEQLYREIISALTDRAYLSTCGISRSRVQERSSDIRYLADMILSYSDQNGRISAGNILKAGAVCLEEMSLIPQEGWALHCYMHVRGTIFPHLGLPDDSEEFRTGRITALTLLRAVFTYERKACRFDPTLDMTLLSDSEAQSEGFASEYIRMHRLVRINFIYEFMRLGTEVTPFNTLGHISGVHYVATYMARQLRDAGIPVDVALASAAAASHDIGKYGCRKSEERRVPYLHYYYTDYCMTENGMPEIAHIAANHSTWDLEFENLSAESLLLIYADFRVKSTREDGKEIIHFYTLEQAFDVILSKLDNVDDAKKHRYEKVYARLKDFEDYMIELGAVTDLPSDFALEDGVITALPAEGTGYRKDKPVRVRREMSLIQGDDIITQLKMKSVGHNIRLMHYFNNKADFARLIEDARGEADWRNLRTYITILGEYSTYMTEEQKALTLRFLYDQLMNRESDVREQSARQMGQMTATFRQSYRKELPEDIPKLDETTTNLEMFEMYLHKMLSPSSRLTERHRNWIIQSMDFYVSTALSSCAKQFLPRYYEVLEKLFEDTGRTERMTMAVLNSALAVDEDTCTDSFREKASGYACNVTGKYSDSTDLLALDVREKFSGDEDGSIRAARLRLMGIDDGGEAAVQSAEERDAALSAMFLDDLKFQTSWTRKTANIRYMTDIAGSSDRNVRMHIAAHFVNLIKVSETVTVRREAGEALLKLIRKMPADQCNEIMVELYNGLDIEDYQFARLIPEYLGRMILLMPDKEIDEVTGNLESHISSGNINTASASLMTVSIMLEHFSEYRRRGTEERCEELVKRLSGLLMKGVAHYRDAVSQEAFRTLAERVFVSGAASDDEKRRILALTGKRILTLIPDTDSEKDAMEFCNNAAALRGIYRFISEYIAEEGPFGLECRQKAAFFPGTFDPFSLGHKAIACTIRDMGYEVYLAIDEFSWSKKTLPHMLRKEILAMSIAAETDMYIFPDDVPVNIANPEDLGILRSLFEDRDLYIAVGSDVVRNASSYKAKPQKNSIHTFNHIVFAREARQTDRGEDEAYPVRGKVINLRLGKFYEDISSTRIRENIDLGRDITSLIDPVVQNYIYENNFYIREPAYKHELQARDIHISGYEHSNCRRIRSLRDELTGRGYDFDSLMTVLERPRVRTIYIERTGTKRTGVCAFASGRRIDRKDLLFEFGDTDVTRSIRRSANGSIGIINAFYFERSRDISNLGQILLTEILTDMLAKDYGYVVYHPADPAGLSQNVTEVLRRQGFVNISEDHDNPVYAVDITAPVVLFRDVETVIKAPLNKNPRVMKAVDDAHNNLLKTFCELYPGKLILSFNTSAVYSKIIEMAAKENMVPSVPDPAKRRGPYMAVPFGKALSDVVVPNTVTKALRTEKFISESIRDFTIRESRGYAELEDQVRTLKSFNRDVILIDDLLHSGQRMKRIDPILRENDVNVRKVIVVLLTGNARDEMAVSRRAVDGAYFIPVITMWLNERDCYPFIGGDSFESGDRNASINIIMPYTSYSFVGGRDSEKVYRYSMTCLENARDIMKVIEQEYQAEFEKQLTLGRLGAVITNPRRPDYGDGLLSDENAAPSVYIESDIKRAKRLHLSRDK